MIVPSLVAPGLRSVARILVIHARGGMGDVLLSTPVLDALKKRYPDAPLDFMARSAAAAMVENHPAVAEVLRVPEGELDAPRTWARWLGRVRQGQYTLGLVLWSKLPEALLLHRGGVRHRVGQDSRLLYSWMYTRRVRIRSEHGDTASHWVQCLMDYARAVGADLSDPRPRLFLDDAARVQAGQILQEVGQDFVVLHVGRGTPLDRSRLPLAPFARIGDALAEAFELPVVLTGSSAEMDVVQGVADEMRHKPAVLAGKLTVPQLGAVMERARVVVANDSGPMHMAAAVDAPTVGLFAMEKDLPQRWGPCGAGNQVVRPATFRCNETCLKETCPRMICYEDLEPAVVVDAARRALTAKEAAG